MVIYLKDTDVAIDWPPSLALPVAEDHIAYRERGRERLFRVIGRTFNAGPLPVSVTIEAVEIAP
jgi:hypothetical protein